MIIKRDTCRICNGQLDTILNLGDIAVATFIKSRETVRTHPFLLARCNSCGLVQLKDTLDPDSMYRQYFYLSGLNDTMVAALADVVASTLSRVAHPEGTWLDIGCNDGTLLATVPNNFYKIGVDPAQNLTHLVKDNCDLFFNDYFKDIPGQADIITSIAMFYDLDTPRAFIDNIRKALRPDGIWVLQLTDLLSMLKINAIDNLCWEHQVYYSATDIVNLLAEHNLDVFDIEYNYVNGGSIRVYVCHKQARPISANVHLALLVETAYLSGFTDPIASFVDRVTTAKQKCVEFITETNRTGNKIFCLGASTKGCTLLQYYGIDSRLVPFALEINPTKYGRFIAGTGIEIISENTGFGLKPDVLFVLPWHFKDYFAEKYKSFSGHLLFPLPEPTMVMRQQETHL